MALNDIRTEDLVNANGLRPFPKDNIDPKLKESPEWHVLVAKSIWGNKNIYGGGLFYNNTGEYAELLKWALGKNDQDEFKPFLGVKPDVNDKTWTKAITWTIRNYVTKRINIVVEKVLDNRYDIEASNINPLAIDAKEDYRARVQLYFDEKKRLDDIQKKTGVDIQSALPSGPTDQPGAPVMPAPPQSQDDIDMFFDTDYKTVAEIGIELGVKHHFDRNQVERKIRPLSVFNTLVYGVSAYYDGMDDNLMPIIEHVDPADLIIPYSKTPDWSALPYVGQVLWMTAADFRKSASGFLEESRINDIITSMSRIPEGNIHYAQELIRASDVHRIPVLRYNYRSTDMVAAIRKTDKFGNKSLYRKDYDYYAPKEIDKPFGEITSDVDAVAASAKFDDDNGRKKLYRKPVNTVYEGYWVIGTETVYRQGRRSVSLRKRGNFGEDLMGYKIYAPNAWAGQITPVMKNVIPVLKDLQKYTLKMQQLIGAAIPKGGFIDLDSLRNAKIKWNDKDLTDQEKIEMFMLTGWGVSSSKNRHQPGSNYKGPIVEAENGMARDVMNYAQLIMNALVELDDHFGLNKASAAATVSPEMGKGVFENQIQQTEVALGWIIRNDYNQLCDLAESVALLHVKSVKYGPKGYYDRIFGRLTSGVLYSDIPFDKADFGFKLSLQPGKAEWQQLFQSATDAYKNGAGWLTYAQLMRVHEFESIKQARRFLASCESKAQAQAAQSKQADVQMTAQVQQESAATTSKLKMAEIAAENQGLIEVEREKRKTLQLKYQLETQMKIAVQQDQRGLAPVIAATNQPPKDLSPAPTPNLDKSIEKSSEMDALKE